MSSEGSEREVGVVKRWAMIGDQFVTELCNDPVGYVLLLMVTFSVCFGLGWLTA